MAKSAVIAHPKCQGLVVVFALFLGAITLSACGGRPRPALPGDTEYTIRAVEIEGAEQLSPGKLPDLVAARVGNLIIPGLVFNPYRAREDRHRIEAYWGNYGFFDVEVGAPDFVFDEATKEVEIHWSVVENERYFIVSVKVEGAPAELEGDLVSLVPFGAGDTIDMEVFRWARHDLAAVLRDHGYGHATVYSRAFLDSQRHEVHWVYFVDAGPKTLLGSVAVSDAQTEVAAAKVLDRMGLEIGQPFDDAARRKAELDLMDTGGFAMVDLEWDADNENTIVPLPPESGGILAPEQVDSRGQLVPRALEEELNLVVNAVDAPAVQTRVDATGQADLARLDSSAGAELKLRNLFGHWHHLVMKGRVGYGSLWRSESDQPLGLYGSAMVRTLHPGFLWRLLDLRLTGRFDDQLFPGFHVRRAGGGVGARSSLTERLFLDLDADFYQVWNQDYGDFDAATTADLQLVEEDAFQVMEFSAGLVWDERAPDRVEALDGHLAAFRGVLSPDFGLGPSYARLSGDLRYFLPLHERKPQRVSLGLRTYGGWLFELGDEGVPPHQRFFGGGPFSTRGFGSQELSSVLEHCDDEGCTLERVGAMSYFLASMDLRWLPWREQYGAIAFADLAAAGDQHNPFAQGLTLALGLGARVRLWYIPLAIDLSYRVLDDDRPQPDHFQFFVRVGEAF